MIARSSIVALIFNCAPLLLIGQQTKPGTVKQRLRTIAGELKIIQLDQGSLGCKFAIVLHAKEIVSSDCEDESGRFSDYHVPAILKHFKSPVHPFEEAVLFQQHMWGNACDGGPMWFLGLKKDGSFEMSQEIDYCGGPEPVVTETADAIIIEIPSHPPKGGDGWIPAETWKYANGNVTRVSDPKELPAGSQE